MPVIYSCLFSNYEEIKEPKVITPGWQYILYTDQDVKSDVWEIVEVCPFEATHPQLMARHYKIMAFQEWEKSIWIDHSFIIDTNLDEWWQKHFKGGLTAPAHPLRNDVYTECLDCIISQRGNKEEVQTQMAEYKALGIPANNGLIQSGLLMRENTEQVVRLCSDWWQEVKTHSIRDQIAFAKVSLDYDCVHTYQFDYRARKDFIYHHHFNRRGGNHVPMT